jgi:hypothetical protein
MPNVVIASTDPLCQSAKNWLVQNNKAVVGPPIDQLEDGNQLIIIAHDTEMGDGSGFVNSINNYPFPMAAKFDVILIVCSAASTLFEKELLTPAERIANYFQRTVHASRTVVQGTWDASKMNMDGDFINVTPNTDITSLMSNLKL